MATWKFALTNLPTATTAQKTVAFLEKPQEMRYTRRRNGYCEMSLEVRDPGDLADLEGAVYRRAVAAWRNGVLRFNGQIVEHEETPEGFTIVAKDAYYNMSWRRVRTDITLGTGDAGGMAQALIDAQNFLQNSFLVEGTINPSVDGIGVKVKEGMVVAEQIDTFARFVGSFAFTIDAVMDVGTLGEFNAHFPINVVKEKARFEFGSRTLENVETYARKALPLVNKINVVGEMAGGATGVGQATSTTSPAIHGLWEDERGHVRVDTISRLEQIAASQIMHYPKYAVSFRPTAEAPQLFTDFDVIHSVPTLIQRRGKTYTGNKPVQRVTISLDPDSGAEVMEELVLIDDDQETE